VQVNLSREAPELTVGVNNDPETISVHCNSGALQLDFQENVISESDELMASKAVHVLDDTCGLHLLSAGVFVRC
jgi:hypothetical protein